MDEDGRQSDDTRTVNAPPLLDPAPTVSLHPRPTGRSVIPDHSDTHFATVEDALRSSERAQSRALAFGGLTLDVIGVVTVVLVEAHPIAQMSLLFALTCGVMANLAMVRWTSTPERYTERAIAFYFVTGAFVNTVALYYVGAYSLLFALLVLMQFTISLGYSQRVGLAHLLSVGGASAALQMAIALELLPNVGQLTTDDLSLTARIILTVAGQFLLLLAYLQGREMRGRLQEAVEERKSAIRAAALREAQLAEAQQDLQHAVAAGGYGRFTEQQLDDYVLGRLLGRGGMGEVYEAHHQTSGRVAAVKTLRADAIRDAEFVRRFIREGKILQGLHSPHIVAVHDVAGRDALLPYIAMEKLEGEDLRAVLARDGQLTPPRVLELVRQVARGISDANDAGIVHRDLKPSNVYRSVNDDRWTWKILDFGVARRLTGSATMTGVGVIGTPQYMAPEQSQGDTVDTRADVYSLGAIAYRALTGHPPFTGKDAVAILHSVLYDDAPPVRDFVDVPRGVERVFRKVLAKRPDERYRGAMEFAGALARALEDTRA